MSNSRSPTLPIYLDYHATTPLDPRVFDAMHPWLTGRFGNPSSVNHAYGWQAADAVRHAREQIATLLHCEPEEVVFTSGATESNNLALKGLFRSGRASGRLIINPAEHNAVLDPARRLKRCGVQVDQVPVTGQGRVDPDRIAEALQQPADCVSVMWANNEVGTINDLAAITQLCHAQKVLIHSDAAQALGRCELDLQQVPVDLLSLSAHKLYGPQGIGALIVHSEAAARRLEPLLEGGGHQRHLRSGTLPVALIVGFGEACELAGQEQAAEQARLRGLRDQLWSRLQQALPDLTRNGGQEPCLAGNLNFSVPGVDGDRLMTAITEIAVSSGAACSTADREPSHVLRAMGVSSDLARASIRVGLGRPTTAAEIERAAESLIRVIGKLRGGSG